MSQRPIFQYDPPASHLFRMTTPQKNQYVCHFFSRLSGSPHRQQQTFRNTYFSLYKLYALLQNIRVKHTNNPAVTHLVTCIHHEKHQTGQPLPVSPFLSNTSNKLLHLEAASSAHHSALSPCFELIHKQPTTHPSDHDAHIAENLGQVVASAIIVSFRRYLYTRVLTSSFL